MPFRESGKPAIKVEMAIKTIESPGKIQTQNADKIVLRILGDIQLLI